ncbi:hypothetical protein LJC32_01960 [Oscillospiraceae bacterium OttesenSCG-928-F05]|nr:hypothetical protein [Oscillospiraceae bacterium OttesenSCG-928-F05]
MFTKENTIVRLKKYRTLQTIKSQLEFELESGMEIISDDDMISSLSLIRPDGENVSTGRSGDRTSAIALSYHEKAEALRLRTKAELQQELRSIVVEMSRIEFYIGLLDEPERDVISALYIEGKRLDEAADRLSISRKTAIARRDKGIAALSAMFSRLVVDE